VLSTLALGEEVSELQPGDRVTAVHRPPCGACRACEAGDEIHCRKSWKSYGHTVDGSYAEYLVAPVASLVPLPGGLSYAEAAPLHCTAAVALGR
jgi:propanol-preferring alcohol dehydrogenase